nr:MAG TPA: hypothetical protein [Caudoviricetes sp.]
MRRSQLENTDFCFCSSPYRLTSYGGERFA